MTEQAYRLSELPRALDEAEARASSGVRGTRWPFCGALLFPGHAVPSTQPPGPGWDRHRCRSRTTGQEYYASASHPGQSIPIVRKPISFRGCLQALVRWDARRGDVPLAQLRQFGKEVAAMAGGSTAR